MLVSATTGRNFLKLVTMFIDCELLEELSKLRQKIIEKKFRIYESFDEYSNLEVLDLNTNVCAKMERVVLEKDSDFAKLKKECLLEIAGIEGRFN